jgi:type IV secretory pathway TrbD component
MGLGYRGSGFGVRIWDIGFGVTIWDLGCRVQG